jgi:hypothetical protein
VGSAITGGFVFFYDLSHQVVHSTPVALSKLDCRRALVFDLFGRAFATDLYKARVLRSKYKTFWCDRTPCLLVHDLREDVPGRVS